MLDIYLHLPQSWPSFVGKYTMEIHGAYGTSTTWPIRPSTTESKGHPQEPNANSVAWNTEMEDGASAAFSAETMWKKSMAFQSQFKRCEACPAWNMNEWLSLPQCLGWMVGQKSNIYIYICIYIYIHVILNVTNKHYNTIVWSMFGNIDHDGGSATTSQRSTSWRTGWWVRGTIPKWPDFRLVTHDPIELLN